ncbi:zinc finger and SCAN domain-containing protein 9-like [Sphaeramia orbicularis]|uniref:Gastrula zinc finger protein XlCGF57.1-like n=1 Tax=Sphaeramia orbicularis TaxID=375764 RepID=A0A672YRY4_9TELE|nr:zinc finger and SCAN domain-containing protein 9-like [Sphaeramia orbicularis]
MSHKKQILRSLVEQRLTAAAEEIFGLFERTIAEYEEELCRTKEENQRQKQILDEVWNLKVLTIPAGSSADVRQSSGVGEEVPPEQEWSFSLDQEEPEPPHIKEKQEELWTNQEAHFPKVLPTTMSVKREDDDKEEAQSSLLLLRQCEEKTKERDEEDTGGSGPNFNQSRIRAFNSRSPGSRRSTRSLQKHKDTQTETRLVDSKCLGESNAPRDEPMGTNFALSDVRCKSRRFQCSDCGKTYCRRSVLNAHRNVHTRERQFQCSVCRKIFSRKSNLVSHMKIHTGEKPYSCPVCQKRFRHKCVMKVHMTTHTGVRAFACSECGRTFTQRSNAVRHMKSHMRKKPVI